MSADYLAIAHACNTSNSITFLGLAQDVAHAASTSIPKSLVLRARTCLVCPTCLRKVPSLILVCKETRQTFRAVFSEPKVVIPTPVDPIVSVPPSSEPQVAPTPAPVVPPAVIDVPVQISAPDANVALSTDSPDASSVNAPVPLSAAEASAAVSTVPVLQDSDAPKDATLPVAGPSAPRSPDTNKRLREEDPEKQDGRQKKKKKKKGKAADGGG
jgi:hypothetical protein